MLKLFAMITAVDLVNGHKSTLMIIKKSLELKSQTICLKRVELWYKIKANEITTYSIKCVVEWAMTERWSIICSKLRIMLIWLEEIVLRLHMCMIVSWWRMFSKLSIYWYLKSITMGYGVYSALYYWWVILRSENDKIKAVRLLIKIKLLRLLSCWVYLIRNNYKKHARLWHQVRGRLWFIEIWMKLKLTIR